MKTMGLAICISFQPGLQEFTIYVSHRICTVLLGCEGDLLFGFQKKLNGCDKTVMFIELCRISCFYYLCCGHLILCIVLKRYADIVVTTRDYIFDLVINLF
jgi:hypothetical protein